MIKVVNFIIIFLIKRNARCLVGLREGRVKTGWGKVRDGFS